MAGGTTGTRGGWQRRLEHSFGRERIRATAVETRLPEFNPEKGMSSHLCGLTLSCSWVVTALRMGSKSSDSCSVSALLWRWGVLLAGLLWLRCVALLSARRPESTRAPLCAPYSLKSGVCMSRSSPVVPNIVSIDVSVPSSIRNSPDQRLLVRHGCRLRPGNQRKRRRCGALWPTPPLIVSRHRSVPFPWNFLQETPAGEELRFHFCRKR